MNCPSPRCGSSNVQLLSHYRDSLPPGSPLRDAYAQPAAAEGSYLLAVGLVVLGVIAVASGTLAGLAAIAAGGVWGWVTRQRVEDADRKRADWVNKRICLACTEQWTP